MPAVRRAVARVRRLDTCCVLYLLAMPSWWRGHVAFCPCGALLILHDDGQWRAHG